MSLAKIDGPLAILRWYLEMGIDEAIAESSVDRLNLPASGEAPTAASKTAPQTAPRAASVTGTLAPPRRESAPAPQRPAAPRSGAAAAERSARDLASAARSLEELEEALAAFDDCALKFTATHLVFGDGNPRSQVMLVGEAPGADEDREGRPFVGVSGQLLDRMMATIGLDRSSFYISNVIYWRPPGNRHPTPAEISLCMPFVHRQIELVNPKILVLVGGASAKALLGRAEGIVKTRGRWFQYQSSGMEGPIDAIATFHPAYLLRQPAQKREAWQDLLTLQERLNLIKR